MPANKNLHGGRWFVPLSSDHRIIYNIYYFSYIEIEVSISIYIFQTPYLVSTWIIIWILVDFIFSSQITISGLSQLMKKMPTFRKQMAQVWLNCQCKFY
jgi:hypothetical protein